MIICQILIKVHFFRNLNSSFSVSILCWRFIFCLVTVKAVKKKSLWIGNNFRCKQISVSVSIIEMLSFSHRDDEMFPFTRGFLVQRKLARKESWTGEKTSIRHISVLEDINIWWYFVKHWNIFRWKQDFVRGRFRFERFYCNASMLFTDVL